MPLKKTLKPLKKVAPKRVVAKATMFNIQVRSRHPSHATLKRSVGKLPFRSVVRLGSVTDLPDTITNGGRRIEINTIEAIKNSADKLRMKRKFVEAGVKTANWVAGRDILTSLTAENGLRFPLVAKHRMGSRGRGNTLIQTQAEWDQWLQGKNLDQYIFEKFYDFVREYRLHVTKNGCFYTCRKVLKNDTPEHDRWRRHEDNCAWYIEENEKFDKPVNWAAIEADCVKALAALGLDVAAFDVKVQSRQHKGRVRENPEWILLESNSAASHGEGTAERYITIIPELLKAKKAGV